MRKLHLYISAISICCISSAIACATMTEVDKDIYKTLPLLTYVDEVSSGGTTTMYFRVYTREIAAFQKDVPIENWPDPITPLNISLEIDHPETGTIFEGQLYVDELTYTHQEIKFIDFKLNYSSLNRSTFSITRCWVKDPKLIDNGDGTITQVSHDCRDTYTINLGDLYKWNSHNKLFGHDPEVLDDSGMLQLSVELNEFLNRKYTSNKKLQPTPLDASKETEAQGGAADL